MKFKNYLRSSFTKVSQHNHTVANEQKERRSNAVFSRKKTRKKKMNSSNPSYQLMDSVIKWGIRFINSIKNFFIFLKIFIIQQRKKQLR